ncbi:MAG: 2Fe-2S iron-sulfur cluster-binding protein, partial [Candidatus Freyarchaeota archaeon]
MGEITIKVDGREVKGREGDSILDVCKANGIHIPTLCHIEGLSAYGAC